MGARGITMSVFLSRFAVSAALFTCVMSAPLRAAQEAPVIVITPSQLPQPIDTVGSTVYRLDVPELIERGVRFVDEALREIPSLVVGSYGARGSQVQLRVRGNEANHVLVLVDGVRMGSAATGEFDLSNLSLVGIARIEVLLGAQSTLYGSDAIGGVIYITTRKGQPGLYGDAQLQLAKRGERDLSVGVAGGKEALSYALNAQVFRTDGISAASEANGNSEPDGHELRSVQAQLGYDWGRASVDLRLGTSRADFDFDDFDYTVGRAVDEEQNTQATDIDRGSLTLRVPASGEGTLSHEILLGRVDEDYQTRSMLYGALADYRARTRRDNAGYRGTFRFGSNSLQFGLERVSEELATESVFSTFDDDVTLDGAYLNWLHQGKETSFSLGARGNDHEAFGSYTTWRATFSHTLDTAWRIRGAAATGFKAPSLQELYDTTFGANPDLQPEESESAELGLEYQVSGYRARLVYFDQTTDHLIRYTGVWPNARNENVGEGRTRGFELSVNRSWERLSLEFALSKLDAKETVNGVTSQRLRVPEWSADLKASLRAGKARVWIEAQYRDERRDFNWGTYSDVWLEPYTLWHMGATIQASDRLTLSGRIDNLTNESYEEVYSYGVPDRTARLGLRWTF